MSRLTNKDYKVSNIDQILNGVKTDKSFNEILDDNTRIRIENALHILADYEDLGSVEEFKDLKEKHYIITGGRSAGKLFTQKAVIEVLGYLKELEQKDQRIEELEEELENLKNQNYQLKQALEFGTNSYAFALLQEQLELVNKANKDTQELVFEYRQKEREEVLEGIAKVEAEAPDMEEVQ